MPIRISMKNGTKYYKWGESGKEYTDKSQAEAQMRAAFANGYKEKDDEKDEKSDKDVKKR